MTVAVAADRDPGLLAHPAATAAGAFAVVAMLSFAQMNIQPFQDAPTVVIAAAALGLVFLRVDQLLAYLRRADPSLLALVALAPLSTFWSVDHEQTMRSARVLIATTAVGVYMALRFDLRSQLRLLITALAIGAVASAVLLALSPGHASVDDFRGHTWRGAFDTKNVFGRAMSLGAIAALFMAVIGRPRRRWPYATAALMCTVLVAVSWSKIALGITLLGVLAVATAAGVARLGERRDLVGLLVLACVVGALATIGWFVSDPNAALGVVGRDATLTGRTGLWKLVLDNIRVHPLGGYGYGAFWSGFSGPSREIWLELPWQPPHAHNGLLELMLNLGVLGGVLWLASLGLTLRRALRRARRGLTIDALWPLVLVVFIVAYNLTEVTGPENNLFWTLYVAMSFSLARPAAPRPVVYGGSP